MRIVVFLASLFFLLLGGRVDAFAGVKATNNYPGGTLAYHAEKKELSVFFSVPGLASIRATTVPEENKIYICEDAEEEDDNQSSRKYQPVSDFFSGFSYQSQLVFRFNCYDATGCFYLHASPRYIFQRTLRI
jgi:hypothetical protein